MNAVPSSTTHSRDDAIRLDEADPLRQFRDRFHVRPGTIYLDGNSLGLPCLDAEEAIHEAVTAWRDRGIDGWTQGDRPWFWLGERLGASFCRRSQLPACGRLLGADGRHLAGPLPFRQHEIGRAHV